MDYHDLQKITDALVVYVRLSEPILDYTSISSEIFIIVDTPEVYMKISINEPDICSIVENNLFPSNRKTLTWDIKQLFSHLRYINKNFNYNPNIIELFSLSLFSSKGEKPANWSEALILFKSLSTKQIMKYHDEVLSPLSSFVLPKLDVYALSDKQTGRRILACYHPEGAVNGRVSATTPSAKFYNPLNSKKEYRSKIATVDGCELVQMDYKAMEIVTAAFLSKDKNLLLTIEQEDPYLAIYEMAFGSYSDKEFARKRAKDIILPLIYGSGKKGLAESLGVSETVAENAEKAIWKIFGELREWLAIKESEACNGSVVDSIGRIRNFPTHAFKARHHCISSPATAHCLDRLCRLSEAKEVNLVLYVHDAFVFGVNKGTKHTLHKVVEVLTAPSSFVDGARYNISISSF